MQRTTHFHGEVVDALLAKALAVLHHATALDVAVEMLHAHTSASDTPIVCFLRA